MHYLAIFVFNMNSLKNFVNNFFVTEFFQKKIVENFGEFSRTFSGL